MSVHNGFISFHGLLPQGARYYLGYESESDSESGSEEEEDEGKQLDVFAGCVGLSFCLTYRLFGLGNA